MSSARSANNDATVDEAVRAAARRVLEVAAVADRPVVLIDGCSGAGKSTLARLVVAQWAPHPERVQLVAMDGLYPGWDGLDAGADLARTGILVPVAAGRQGRWQRWDWERSEPAESHIVDPGRPLVVEGSGVLTPGSAPLAPVRVWVRSPEASRRERALTRDGDLYRPHWERWAAQERRHIDRDRPETLATLVVDVP